MREPGTGRDSTSCADVDDRAAGRLAVEDRRERGVEIVECDVVTDAVEPGGLEIGGNTPPYRASTIDRGHDRVDAEQVDATEDERQHCRRQAAAAREAAGGDRAAVVDP